MSQQFSRRRVAGVFKPDAIARLQQGVRNQRDGVAISRGHEYLRRRAVDPARNLQICSDLGTQQRQAVYGRVDHVGGVHGADAPRAQPCPDLSRKHVQRRQAHLERQDQLGAKAGRGNAAIGPGHRACNRHLRLEARRDDGPRLAAGLNVALGGQQRISRFDRASCQPQFLGQRACGWNAVTRLQHAAGNGAAKPIVDLAIKRLSRGWIQRRDVAGVCGGHGVDPVGRISEA